MSAKNLVISFVCVAVSGFASSPLSNLSRPLSFEPNRGQTDKQVQFLAHGLNYNLFLSNGEAVIVAGQDIVRMATVGSNRAVRGELVHPLPGISNYFIGNNPAKWRTNVPTYSKVRYPSVYPGVDLIYYGNQRQLEYDFVVQPGGDPRAIVVEMQERQETKSDHLPDGPWEMREPVAYQEIGGKRRPIECAFVRDRGRLRFAIGAYDRTKTLVIDPVIVYSTYLGGSGGDGAYAVALDANGSAYVTGVTGSTNFPTKDPFQAGFASAFVSKFDPAGNELVYSTYLGGSNGNSANGIAVDAGGNAYIAGSTTSTDFPTKNAFQSSLNGPNGNAFVTKLSASGCALVFSTYLGGSGNGNDLGGDSASGIALDPSGNAYIAGVTFSSDFPTKNAFEPYDPKSEKYWSSAFVAKFSTDGPLDYSTYLGGEGPSAGASDGDGGLGIAVDSSGSAYVTGYTGTDSFPLKDPFQGANGGTADGYPGTNAFVTKFSPAGNTLVYSTYLGGSIPCGACVDVDDIGTGIAVDDTGKAYVTGVAGSTDFPVKNAFQKKLKGVSSSAFVTKFDRAGTALIYSTILGGSGNGSVISDQANAIGVDSEGEAYVTGWTISTDFPTKNAFQEHNKTEGYYTAFVTKFCPVGTLLYSSYLGGSNGDFGYGIAVDSEKNAYVVGVTSSSDFPTKNPFQDSLEAPGGNAFVTKIGPN